MLASLACAPRRLACRYWAGRVALRENRARQHLPAGPRGSEAARPKDKSLEISGGALRCSLCPARAPPEPGAALLGTARSWRGIVPFTHLAREGRMTVTIGRRELLAALGGGVAARGKRVAARAHAAGRRTDWPSYGWLDLRNRLKGSQPGRLSYVQIRRAPRCLSRQCVSWALNLSLIPRWRSRQKLVRLEIESRDSTLRRRSIRPGPFRWQRED